MMKVLASREGSEVEGTRWRVGLVVDAAVSGAMALNVVKQTTLLINAFIPREKRCPTYAF